MVIGNPGMRVLENAIVRFEPQVAAHADAMFEVLGDPAIYEHENEPPPTAEWLRERFSLLESRRSPDAAQLWLTWVVLLPSSPPIGFVQATVYPSRLATALEPGVTARTGPGGGKAVSSRT